MKTQERLAIDGPSEALRAIGIAIKALVSGPEHAVKLDEATLRPVGVQVTRDGSVGTSEYIFEVTHDGAGLCDHIVNLPEPVKLLVQA